MCASGRAVRLSGPIFNVSHTKLYGDNCRLLRPVSKETRWDEQNIYLQRRSSHSFFKRYTRLYHEPWHSVFNQIIHQMAGSTADLCWKEVAAHKLHGKTHLKVVCIHRRKTEGCRPPKIVPRTGYI